MSSFKLSKTIRIAIFLLIFILLSNAFSFLTSPADLQTRMMLHELYSQKSNIDIAFLGASHCSSGIDPSVFDDGLQQNTFNLGSSAQTIKASYYLLQELFKQHKPRKVILDLSWIMFYKDDEMISPASNYELFDYFKPSSNKIAYFFDAFSPEYYTGVLFPAYRYRGNLNPQLIKKSMRTKLSKAYQNYEYTTVGNESVRYLGKGFLYNSLAMPKSNIGKMNPDPWDSDLINSSAQEYVKKIKLLCDQNSAQLIFITIPVQIATLLESSKYGEINSFMKQMADQIGAPYYDFNLLRPEVLQRQDDSFYDSEHMNGAFSQQFSRVLTNCLKEYDEKDFINPAYFYESYDEFNGSINYVASTWFTAEKVNDSTKLHAFSNSGKTVEPEYEFLYKEQNAKQYTVLQAYSKNAEALFIPKDGLQYVIRVNARSKGSDLPYMQYLESPL